MNNITFDVSTTDRKQLADGNALIVFMAEATLALSRQLNALYWRRTCF